MSNLRCGECRSGVLLPVLGPTAAAAVERGCATRGAAKAAAYTDRLRSCPLLLEVRGSEDRLLVLGSSGACCWAFAFLWPVSCSACAHPSLHG